MAAFLTTAPPSRHTRMEASQICQRTTNMIMTSTNPALHAFTQVLPSSTLCPPLTTFLLGWADLVSLLLLTLTITAGGIDPFRRVWGYNKLRNISLTTFMGLTITFSAARFLVEGACVVVGAREFLFTSVIYCARWIWLFFSITRSGSRAAKAFHVARALKELKTIRLGSSTARGRRGDKELVVRRGARVVTGEVYWRGVEESTRFDEDKKTWMIRLVEKELHSNLLDSVGTIEFRKKIGSDSTDGLYKMFYDLIMTVDAGNEELVVDYSEFLEEFGAVSRDTRQAQRVGAVRDDELGNVARRVAADACYYIWFGDGDFRTEKHVERINACVENAANGYFE